MTRLISQLRLNHWQWLSQSLRAIAPYQESTATNMYCDN